MLETALYIALGLAAVVAGVLFLAMRRPDTQKIVRSADIAAAPESIFPMINDLRLLSTWSPFEKDPEMQRSYSGPDQGQGQRMDWNGNSQVGEGSLAILSSVPYSRVDMQLNFVRPMCGDNHVTFTLMPTTGGATKVNWAMEGGVPLIAKVMQLFIDMDRMCGAEFERGLANLKDKIERSHAAAAQA